MSCKSSPTKLLLLSIIISIPLFLLACMANLSRPAGISTSAQKKLFITDIKITSEVKKSILTLYSNHMFTYTSFVQQDPPALVLDIPGFYIHKNLKPLDLAQGPIQKVVPEQLSFEEPVKARFTIQMKEEFPHEITTEENQLKIAIIPDKTEDKGDISPPALNKDQVTPPEDKSKKGVLRTLSTPANKEDVNENSLKPADLKKTEYTGKSISLDFQNADIHSVLRIIADVSGHNLVIDPEVKGKVDITLIKPVPWDQALDVILKTNKLDMKMEGNIIRIGLPKTFSAEKEAALAIIQAERKAKEEELKSKPLETKIICINYAKAEVLMKKLQPMLSKGDGLAEPPSIVVDERTNTLIIKDLPEVVKKIIKIIERLDRPTPQVMIEARIVETKKSFIKDFGIQWGGTYSRKTNYRFANTVEVRGTTGTATGASVDSPTGRVDEYAVDLPISSGAFGAIGINLGHINSANSLEIQLKAMERSGKIRVISNPRIATLDNEEATIKSGTKIPYQTVDKEGNPSTNFVDAAINLTVTPQITPDNKITMKIQADKSEPDWSNAVLGAPAIFTRTATTRLIVADGDTAVIGGLNIQNRANQIKKVPFFGDIPIIGHIFKTQDNDDNFDEILIFITPTVIKSAKIDPAMLKGDES